MWDQTAIRPNINSWGILLYLFDKKRSTDVHQDLEEENF
jgi:hypothetical protein